MPRRIGRNLSNETRILPEIRHPAAGRKEMRKTLNIPSRHVL
jgi:hypothetical protein